MKTINTGAKTHDYTLPMWGHDYVVNEVVDDGQELQMMGWGDGIDVGDFLIIRNGTKTTRYRVKTIKYFRDPPDMWDMTATFAPRPNQD